jgi:hypothetical protein
LRCPSARIADGLAHQLVLGNPAQRGRDLGDRVGLAAVDPARLLRERGPQDRRERGRALAVEAFALPHELALGDDEQQPVDGAMFQPPRELTLDPSRAGGRS